MLLNLPDIAVIGIATVLALYIGKGTRKLGLPSLIGYMLLGSIMGTSVLNILNEQSLHNLKFVTEIALGFVAFTIGSELSIRSITRLGKGIIAIILLESFSAFIFVTLGVYLLTNDLPMALVFGALAPASAPAGTVAVIQECKAKGSLTRALYAVVGFDDGLAIVIFGFALAIARKMLQAEVSASTDSLLASTAKPLLELGLSLGAGALLGLLFAGLARRLKPFTDIPALIFGFIAAATGLCLKFNLSLILMNMMLGFVLANTSSRRAVHSIVGQLKNYMPLLFILFFLLAGAHLKITTLPSLGLLGVVYIFTRSAGLMGGSWLGARIGKSEPKIRKYLGLGILSQAGVAIGLSLIVTQEFTAINTSHSLAISAAVITSITATSVIFEIVGPILTKHALRKAGEISDA